MVDKQLQTQDISSKLPTLAELQSDIELAFKNDDLNKLLNAKVPEKWIKQHPFVNIKVPIGNGGTKSVPLPYIPVRSVKVILRRLFGGYEWKINQVGQILNGIYVTGTLAVKNPITGEYMRQDGCGAAQIQMDAGATQGDLSKIKANAIQIGLPAAESYALKNAAEKFGDIFGGNLYDLDGTQFVPSYDDKVREIYTPQNNKNGI